MSISAKDTNSVLVIEVWFDNSKIYTRLSDGREIAVPLEWFPRLKNADYQKRNNWRILGGGIGIHWPDIDEDINVYNLIQPEAFPLHFKEK